MKKVGIAELPLHYGHVPFWLLNRMKRLGKQIATLIIKEYDKEELLRRISNPFWFQAFGCVIGHDWHSSGVTTTVCAVLKSVLEPGEFGLGIAGGKGKASRKTPEEIEKIGQDLSLSSKKIEELKYASRMSAKVDNTAIQCNYPLYHHTFFFTEKFWVVVQQGMNTENNTARRYHWISENLKSFVEEPHSAICCDVKEENVLDMTAKQSEEARKISLDLVKEGPKRIKNDLLALRPTYQKSLKEFLHLKKRDFVVRTLKMPKNVNWEALNQAYEFQPKNYEELLGIRGIGPSTVRGLALVSEIIYGSPPSWKDPVKYSYAYGGKDGVPKPIEKKAMDESIKFLEEILKETEIKKKEKLEALKRLKSLVPKDKFNKKE
ncbi:MAG: DUF763 domain-containing protein [Candidatus Aenigmatarchaeota archaeon]